MSVYEKSRYEKLNIFRDRKSGTVYMDFPTTFIEPSSSDFIYQVRSGETLEFLATQFYGNPQLKWILLYANPQYITELDMQVGDLINIPEKGRVMDIVNGS